MLFAHLKRILRLGRLRLRGPCGAQFEFTLAAIAQNLRRLAKLIARPHQSPLRALRSVASVSKIERKSPAQSSGWQRTASKNTRAVPRRLHADFYNKIRQNRTFLKFRPALPRALRVAEEHFDVGR
jgi:hypothetical protein